MSVITAKKVDISGEKIRLRSRYRKFDVDKQDFEEFRVIRVPSLYDEIGIELSGSKTFLVPERAVGFFDLAASLEVERIFGPLWYRDAEDGHELRHSFSETA